MRIQLLLIPLFFLLFLPGCSLIHPTVGAPTLSGRVMLAGKPVAGVQVEAYPAGTAVLSSPLEVSALSTASGHFDLHLPDGRYYLIARGEGLYAFYGRNPVTLSEGGLHDLNIGLVRLPGPPQDLDPMTVSGAAVQVSHGGKPLAGATLYAYLDLTSELKGMGFAMVGPSDAEGIAELTLPAGTYYILARKRHSGAGVGPLQAGDFVGYYPDNPIHLQQEQVVQLALPMLEVPQKLASLQENLFGTTVLHGRLRDAAGNAVVGARAVLYRDSQMLNRPDFVSAPTDAEGRFTLSLPEGGRFYLAGRNTLGGAPGPGDLYGTYNQTPDHSLILQSGQSVEGLEVILEEMW